MLAAICIYDFGPMDARYDRRFEFKKSRQLFIRAHNEPFSVPAMRVNNPDRSPARIDG